MVERASVCPIRDKKHANFNIWTLCTTLAQILVSSMLTTIPSATRFKETTNAVRNAFFVNAYE